MKTALLLTVLAAPLAAQLTPWIELNDGWTHSRTGRRVQLKKGSVSFNPRGDYRLTKTVEIPTGTDTTCLAVTLGSITGAYRLALNGTVLGETPDYGQRYEPAPHARTFSIPPDLLRAGSSAELSLDITNRQGPMSVRFANSVLTGREAAQAVAAAEIATVRLARVSNLFLCALALLLSAFILAAAYRSPHIGAAAWLAVWLLCETAVRGLAATVVFAFTPGLAAYRFWQEVLGIASPLVLCEFLARMLPMPRAWRLWAYPLTALGLWWPGFEWLPVAVLVFLQRGDRRSLPLTVSVVLVAVLEAAVRQRWMAVTFSWGPLLFPYTAVVPVVFGSILILLVARRLLDDRLKKDRLSEELRAAATVQQLMLPSAEVAAGGWRAAAVYEPALEVGGDFYWSQTEDDGSLTVAVGDVSGKGLRAAMLATFCTGVLRQGRGGQPGQLLHDLNQALADRAAGGFVTCCCARFSPEGHINLASAGHPPPYVDGAAAPLESGLPLGVIRDAAWPETGLPGRHLTFVSDGVIEAANPQGELFGFDRTAALSSQSARDIAEAAKLWGQNDDITVVTVRRKG